MGQAWGCVLLMTVKKYWNNLRSYMTRRLSMHNLLVQLHVISRIYVHDYFSQCIIWCSLWLWLFMHTRGIKKLQWQWRSTWQVMVDDGFNWLIYICSWQSLPEHTHSTTQTNDWDDVLLYDDGDRYPLMMQWWEYPLIRALTVCPLMIAVMECIYLVTKIITALVWQTTLID